MTRAAPWVTVVMGCGYDGPLLTSETWTGAVLHHKRPRRDSLGRIVNERLRKQRARGR